jgi:NAD(P)-dependent dehydrogenase (short-subunit alcohol dehydrogenase family)
MRILATNLTGAYLVTRQALELMSPGGRIVNQSSVLGRFGVSGYAAYCTAKHGIIGFTRALALELAPREITVNALCPGWVQTDMADQGIQESAAALGITREEFREQAIQGVPLKRFLDPTEVAKLALFLTSDEASGITGQTYNICGGQVMS